MKIAISGHNGGIGTELQKQLKEKIDGCEILGFSRTTGYDLQTQDGCDRMAKAASDSDIFINCVFGGHAQTMALYRMWQEWDTQKKIICSIDSNAVDRLTHFPFPYAAWKAAHQRACNQLEQLHRPSQGVHCKVVYPQYGVVDTECSKRLIPQYNTLKTIKVADAVKCAIDLVMMNYHSDYYYPTIKMLPEEHINDCWVYMSEIIDKIDTSNYKASTTLTGGEAGN